MRNVGYTRDVHETSESETKMLSSQDRDVFKIPRRDVQKNASRPSQDRDYIPGTHVYVLKRFSHFTTLLPSMNKTKWKDVS